MLSWLKKLEKKETNPTKKQKDVKLREYFEKQFPELRKQREDKERFRASDNVLEVTQNSKKLWMDYKNKN